MQGKKKERVNKPRVKLTKKLIDSLTCPDNGQDFYRDTELPGFGLRLTPGTKTFIIEKRINGRPRRFVIGPFGPFTVEQARNKARKLIGDIADGEDPAQARIDKRREATFKDLEELYREHHIPKKKSGWADIDAIERYLIEWRGRKLSSFHRSDVVKLHAKIGKDHPYRANRVVALIGRMFTLAKIWGLHSGENPAIGIELFREEKRDRFLSPDELKKIVESIKQEQDPWVKGAFIAMILTGQRKTEVLSMRWQDLDMEQGVWRIGDTKAGRPHYVPMPHPVISMLSVIPRMKGNPHVFCGRTRGGRLVGVNKAWERIRKRANLEDIRIHDLRRTTGSWMAASGESLIMIGKTLNHSQLKTTQIYARLALDPVRAALEANAQRMLAVADMNVLEGKGDE